MSLRQEHVLFRIDSVNEIDEVEDSPTLTSLSESTTEKLVASVNDAEECCRSDEFCFDQNFILSDSDLEQRLNYLISKFCVQKSKIQPLQRKKLVKQSQVSEEEEQIDKPRKLNKLNETFSIEDYFDDDPLPPPRRRAQTLSAPSLGATTSIRRKPQQQLYLAARFPSRNKEEVYQILKTQNVCMESISCAGTHISGSLQVTNVAFEKQVRLHYSLDSWKTYMEIPCWFSHSNGISDTFCFKFSLPSDLAVGSCCEIRFHYLSGGEEFWDNNEGNNYILDYCASLQA